MASFVLTCFDRPGGLDLRLATRAAHLAHVAAHAETVRLAGPVLDAAGAMAGSLFLLEAPDLAAARAFHDTDPYTLAGLFERAELWPFRAAVGRVP